MKFRELPLKSRFSTDKYAELVLTKQRYSLVTCCTPEYNASYDKKGVKYVLIDTEEDVNVVELHVEKESTIKSKSKSHSKSGGGKFGFSIRKTGEEK